jgi:hypothetical protein
MRRAAVVGPITPSAYPVCRIRTRWRAMNRVAEHSNSVPFAIPSAAKNRGAPLRFFVAIRTTALTGKTRRAYVNVNFHSPSNLGLTDGRNNL